MRALLILLLVSVVGALTYAGGKRFGSLPKADASVPRLATAITPTLPNPQAIARETQKQLAALPTTIWAPAQSESPTMRELPALASSFEAPAATSTEARNATPVSPARVSDPTEMLDSLGNSISAIVRTNGSSRLVIADRNTTIRRTLVVGDTYQDGWKISQIQTNAVVLTKQGRSLSVNVGTSATLNRPARFAQAVPPTTRETISGLPPIAPAPDRSHRRVVRRPIARN